MASLPKTRQSRITSFSCDVLLWVTERGHEYCVRAVCYPPFSPHLECEKFKGSTTYTSVIHIAINIRELASRPQFYLLHKVLSRFHVSQSVVNPRIVHV